MNIGGTMSKALHCSADLGIPAGFGRIENRHPDRCRYSSRACLSDPDTSQIAEYSWWKGLLSPGIRRWPPEGPEIYGNVRN
jgi:hypothetical protein